MWTNASNFSVCLQNYSSIITVHPEIIDGRPGTMVIESFVVDVPDGNTKDETCYFVEALIKCNLKSLADVCERLAIQDRTDHIDRVWLGVPRFAASGSDQSISLRKESWYTFLTKKRVERPVFCQSSSSEILSAISILISIYRIMVWVCCSIVSCNFCLLCSTHFFLEFGDFSVICVLLTLCWEWVVNILG